MEIENRVAAGGGAELGQPPQPGTGRRLRQRVLGTIDPPSVLRWRRAGKHRRSRLDELLAGGKINLAYPDEYLAELADRLSQVNAAHLPVISREDRRLVGYIGWKDLMRVRAKLQAEESEKTSFFSAGGG